MSGLQWLNTQDNLSIDSRAIQNHGIVISSILTSLTLTCWGSTARTEFVLQAPEAQKMQITDEMQRIFNIYHLHSLD